MIVLAMDTATSRPVVVLRLHDGTLVEPLHHSESAAPHGRRIVPLIREALARSPKARPDLIGVGLGPGSFTGLRVGLMAAKTLAYAWNCPLVGFDSLEALAHASSCRGRFAVMIDAQRGGVFAALFSRDGPRGPVETLHASHVVEAATWLAAIDHRGVILSPDVDRLRVVAGPALAGREATAAVQRAGSLVEMASIAWERGERIDPFLVEPTYGRPSAAEEKRDA